MNNPVKMIIMKNWIFPVLALMISGGCSLTPDEPDPVFEYTKKSAEVINTNNDFGITLFKDVITHDETDNVMISPASVSLALGMAYNGAETTTQEAFEAVLNYEGLTPGEINEISRDLIRVLVTDSDGNLLEIANSIWYRQGFPVLQGFLDLNRTYFDAEISELDFSSPGAVKTINDWVSEKTHGKIDRIIDQLSPESMMVLINALYFNCLWETEFDPDETAERMFYKSDGTEYGTVDMMTTESTFRVAASDSYTGVELPYKNEKFSMYLFLPASGSDVETLAASLDGGTWNSWMEGFAEQNKVQVTMPKFTFDYRTSLVEPLDRMGLTVAFTDSADFSGISDIDLLISDVIHKTYVDVNEEGTEAAAVTAIVFETTSVGGGPTVITFDRPFLFAITENSSKSIVFMGKVEAPEYEE